MGDYDSIPAEAVGLKLYRITAKDDLIACEAVRFTNGRAGVVRACMLARVAGRCEVGGDINDHFADVLDDDQSILETVALNAKSYSSLKNKWMKCKLEPAQ